MLRRLLSMPEVESAGVDGEERLAVHARMLARKPMLRGVFEDMHREMRALDDAQFGGTPGLRIEFGAGVAPMRQTFPDVLATDVVPGAHLDRVMDAQAMDVPDASIRAVFAQNTFHHLPEPRRFFAELMRAVHPGGGAVLIEPYFGPFAAALYPRLFRTEGYDKAYPSWEVPMTGPMGGANQALSYLVFRRDRAVFEREFPKLRIVAEQPMTSAVRYLLSGGLNFRQLVPSCAARPLRGLERALGRTAPLWALHHVVVLRREP